jgi:hypothetical protein
MSLNKNKKENGDLIEIGKVNINFILSMLFGHYHQQNKEMELKN